MNDGLLSCLFYRAQEKLVKLTNITGVAIHPKPIERQKVVPVLQIFNERTIAALNQALEQLPSSKKYCNFGMLSTFSPQTQENGSYALQNQHPTREMIIIYYHELAFIFSKKKHFN